jgi:hypothetical protein
MGHGREASPRGEEELRPALVRRNPKMQAWSDGSQQAWYPPSNSCSVQSIINVHLCGHRFQPVRDPQRFPVCPRCKELAGVLWGPE